MAKRTWEQMEPEVNRGTKTEQKVNAFYGHLISEIMNGDLSE